MIERKTSKVIWLVDDNPADARLATELLEQASGNVVIKHHNNGKDAFEALVASMENKSGPDLIILDLNMPLWDGRSTLIAIRANKLTKGLPVIIFSSSESQFDMITSYQLGANAYLVKPYNLEQYRTLMQGVIDFWFKTCIIPNQYA